MFEAQQEFIHTVSSQVAGDLTMEAVRRENDDVTLTYHTRRRPECGNVPVRAGRNREEKLSRYS